jgi:glycosyltransferase involved in cell wall biosynthesis
MAGESKNLTLVVPVFNEAKRWNQGYWSQVLAITNINWIFVNDGSSDTTTELLAKLKAASHVTVLEHEVNRGKAEAIRSGFNFFFKNSDLHTGKSFIGYLDADEAFDPKEIARFLNLSINDSNHLVSQGFQAIWSSRVQLRGRRIERKKYRHYLGRIIISFLGSASPSIPYDSQSGFKIFASDENLQQVFMDNFKTKWFIDLEIAARYQQISGEQLRIWEEPLLFWRDVGGSAIKIGSLPTIFIEIVRIYFLLRKSTKSASHK